VSCKHGDNELERRLKHFINESLSRPCSFLELVSLLTCSNKLNELDTILHFLDDEGKQNQGTRQRCLSLFLALHALKGEDTEQQQKEHDDHEEKQRMSLKHPFHRRDLVFLVLPPVFLISSVASLLSFSCLSLACLYQSHPFALTVT